MGRDRLGETPLATVPTTPGVYLMFGAGEELLYVGKAKSLRTRLRSYARAGRAGKVGELVAAIRVVRWEEWPSEKAARERETLLLRALRPPYNDTHTDRMEYLYVSVSAGERGRTRLAMVATPVGDRIYGCFPFAAAVPTAFPALVRLLCLAGGQRPPSRPVRSGGCLVLLPDDLRSPLHAFLAGRSPRLVTVLAARLADTDELTGRSVRRDLDTLRHFYAEGPRTVRRLRERHGGPSGPLSAADLHDLVAEQLRAELGVDLYVRPRVDVERRIWAMYADGHGAGRVAAVLNADGVPRFGGGRWSIGDVDRVIRAGGDTALRT